MDGESREREDVGVGRSGCIDGRVGWTCVGRAAGVAR